MSMSDFCRNYSKIKTFDQEPALVVVLFEKNNPDFNLSTKYHTSHMTNMPHTIIRGLEAI